MFALISECYGVEFNSGEDLLQLNAHATAVAGLTTGEAEDLALHGHDPDQDATLQGIEIGLGVHPTDFIEGFASANIFLNRDDNLEAEWEEGFLKWKDIPGGFELRGGAYLNRLGLQNNLHLHSWDFVDANLSTSQFLGEEGLFTEGGEISWFHQYQESLLGFSGSIGRAREHAHEEESTGDEHGHSESLENASFGNLLWANRVFIRYNYNDFHLHQLGANLAIGENGYDRDTQLYSIDYQYTWRENGFELGGKMIKAQLEYMLRNVEWQAEERSGDNTQSSIMTSLAYTFAKDWTAATRFGWIEGVKASPELHMGEIEYGFATDEIIRTSLALTRTFSIAPEWGGNVRLQYNCDDRKATQETDHSVWLQLSLNYGYSEIR